ncbi:MAG: septum formation inhibitor Maf [Gammaproteobacteria bacterium]|nr:septum formation inhibitor Maf [Gammaproteobacteria bacterium]
MVATHNPIILASTSPYRRELLGRLGMPFSVCSPEVDETSLPGESPLELVRRLSEAKARAGALQQASHALVIGSDQVAVVGAEVLGKPGTVERACAQLTRLSGQCVTFLTGLCLYNSVTQHAQVEVVPFTVVFRSLTARQIADYVRREQPLNCAGSFKSEGLGVALFERMEGDDPTALIGLPLIRLVSMLEAEGMAVLGK